MSASRKEYSIRLAKAADGPRCNNFHNSYYKVSRTLKQWEWEFTRTADEDGTIPFAIAECNGEIVGTQALIPIDLIGSNGVLRSAKSEATLISESMRGMGVFGKLYDPLLEYAQRHQVTAIWGFTPAGSAFSKAGFEIPGKTAQLFRPFRWDAATALRRGAKRRRSRAAIEAVGSVALAAYGSIRSALGTERQCSLDLRTLDRSPDWADALSSRFIEQWGGCSIHRSVEYLQWRIFDNPYVRPIAVAAFVEGEPVGMVCFAMSEDRVASVVDIVAVDAPAGGPTANMVTAVLLDHVAGRAQSMGATAIRCWSVTNHPYDRVVRSAAKRIGWVQSHLGYDVVLKRLDGAQTLAPFSDWYVSRIFTEGSLG